MTVHVHKGILLIVP